MINKVLFPAAGYGTRFLPITKSVPKEMLPILDKPLLHYAVKEAYDAGCNIMSIVTGKHKRAIEDYFDINLEVESLVKGTYKEKLLKEVNMLRDNCDFLYTRQLEMKGLGHAILTGKSLIGNNPFAVILADDLCVGNVLKDMIKLYEKYKCNIIAVEEVGIEHISKYGVIESADDLEENCYRVKTTVEKPNKKDAPSNLAIIGRYILTADIFDVIEKVLPDKNGEIQITDALKMESLKGNVIAYKIKTKRYDCGSFSGFIEANNHYYKKNKE